MVGGRNMGTEYGVISSMVSGGSVMSLRDCVIIGSCILVLVLMVSY